jgi:hypothetical protein
MLSICNVGRMIFAEKNERCQRTGRASVLASKHVRRATSQLEPRRSYLIDLRRDPNRNMIERQSFTNEDSRVLPNQLSFWFEPEAGMSFQNVGIGKFLRVLCAAPPERRRLLRDDARGAVVRAHSAGNSAGGDFHVPFWADA